LTVQLVAGERCALAASAGPIGCAPDEPSKRFLATQTLDEARHVEIFSQRLYDLGVKKEELEDAARVGVSDPVIVCSSKQPVSRARVESPRPNALPRTPIGIGSRFEWLRCAPANARTLCWSLLECVFDSAAESLAGSPVGQ
jgi:hypothetical protein